MLKVFTALDNLSKAAASDKIKQLNNLISWLTGNVVGWVPAGIRVLCDQEQKVQKKERKYSS